MNKTICPTCKQANTIVNECRCDPNNLPTTITKFSLLNVYTRDGGIVTGAWLQNHVGTLETAKEAARKTEAANGNKISVAVVPEVNSPTPILSSPFQAIEL